MKQWWQPPQLRLGEDSEAERRATWLELFYDLVFVVAIAQLAHKLNEDISLSGFIGFVALFIPVWWSWIGAAFYAIAFSFWWVYFDNLDASAIQAARTSGRVKIYQLWLYAHLPLVFGLTATGVGIEHIILSKSEVPLPATERWLLCGAVALCFLALSAIHRTTVESGSGKCSQSQVNYRLGTAAVVFVLALLVTGVLPVVLLGLVAVVCILQVVFDLYTKSWTETRVDSIQ